MPTSYTSLLGLALPVTGELSGTWGDTVNSYITQYVDAAVEGTQTISGTQTAVTLSTANGTALSQAGSGATGSAQYAVINCTGNPASLLTITVPNSSRNYIVINSTSTSQSVKVVGTGPTTGVTLASGEKAVIAWNGSDFIKIASTVALPAGSTTQVQYNNAGALAGSANLTFDGTTLTAANFADSSLTSGRVTYATTGGNLTDSANLTFDGSNLGVGATTVAARVDIVGSTDNQFRLSSNETNATTKEGKFLLRHYTNAQPNFLVMYPYSTSTDNAVFYGGGSSSQTAATFHAWMTAANNTTVSGTEQMRLTSTGLGIGTSSPVGKLDVSGSNAGSVLTSRILNTSTSASSDAQNFIYVNGATAGDAYTTWTVGGVTSWSGGVRNSDSDNWYLSPGSSLATSPTLVATTSGDVGIGTNSPSSSLVVQRASAVSSFGIRHTASGNGYGYRFATSGTTTNDLTISSEFNGSLTTRATITAAGFTRPVAYADTVSALGNTGTATTINLQNANVFTATLTGNCTFTLSNPIATGSSSFTLILTNDGTAGRTVAWSGGAFRFPGGAASLSRTTTANATDIWVFFTPDGGTTWYGNIAMKNMAA